MSSTTSSVLIFIVGFIILVAIIGGVAILKVWGRYKLRVAAINNSVVGQNASQ